uniref:Immunoglobulin V-set domain-containing protein n=1 Tax=Denticeps clupeoides TaxID=299321 RepID=A0AAY4AEG6_9TELE
MGGILTVEPVTFPLVSPIFFSLMPVMLNVYQSPADLITVSDKAVFQCFHKLDNYDRILWYKYTTQRQFHFLGYLNRNYGYPEEELKNKISFTGDGQNNASMAMSSLTPDDSAVYFCAARLHSAANPPAAAQNAFFQHLT